MEKGQGDNSSSSISDIPDDDPEYYAYGCAAELKRLATMRGDIWICGCGHKFGTKEGCAKGLTAQHVKDHETSNKHTRWKAEAAREAAEQASAKKQSSASRGITSFFKPVEDSASPAPVATTGQPQEQEPDAEVLCLEDAGSESQSPTSPMAIGGDSDVNENIDRDYEQPVIEPPHPSCAGYRPDLPLLGQRGYGREGRPMAAKKSRFLRRWRYLNTAMTQGLDKAMFSLDSLAGVHATLEMLIEKTPGAMSKIVKPSTTSVVGLPYHPTLEGGTPSPQPQGNLECRICHKKGIEPSDLRHHIGAHVLHAQVLAKQSEEGTLDQDGAVEAASISHLLNPVTCGFCGRGDGACETFLKQGSSKKVEVCTSTCPDAPRRPGAVETWDVGLTMGSARKGTKYKPSLNLPMLCELCPGAKYVWKYNMAAHIKSVHSHVDGGGSPGFRAQIAISEEERESVLGLIGKSKQELARKRATTENAGTRREVRQRQSIVIDGGSSSTTGGATDETPV